MSCSKKDATAYQTLLTRSIGSLVVAFKSTGNEYFRTTAVLLFDMIYLTAIGLTPGGSSTYLHTNNT